MFFNREALNKNVIVSAIVPFVAFPMAAPVNAFSLEEVVVTAQKREESLQEVPLSITAFNEELLEAQRIGDMQSVAAATPNFTYSAFSATRPELSIRGIGTVGVVRAGLDNAVNVFVDEVYISRASASVFELFDLERLEVLRGPQGTLFGKNVVGGAVSITTRKPNLEELEGRVKLSVGNLDYTEFKGYVSAPLSDSVAGKISISKQDREGYGKDRISGQETDDLDSASLRAQLLVSVSDSVELLLTADYSESEGAGKTLSDTSRSARTGELLDTNPFTSHHGVDMGFDSENSGFSAKFDMEVGSGLVTAIAAYRESELELVEPFTPGTVPALGGVSAVSDIFSQAEDGEQTTFEFRYASENDGPLNWVAGVYYIEEETRRLECEAVITDYTNGIGGDFGEFGPDFSGFIHGIGVDAMSEGCWDQAVKNEGWAAFVDGSYDISDSLVVRMGVRNTEETRKSNSKTFAPNPLPAGFTVFGGPRVAAFLEEEYDIDVEETFEGVTPRLVLEWSPADDVLIYGSASRGFKAGGFDGKTTNAVTAAIPFDNEFAWSYELGMKGSFLDNTLTVNTSIFRTDFQDLQQLVLVPTGGLAIVNAAEATIEGVEVEVSWVPIPSLYITAGYGYLDATYDKYIIEATGEDRSGRDLPNSPENKANINIAYDIDLKGGGVVRNNLGINWTDDYINNSGFPERTRVDSYTLVNGSISYIFPGDSITITVWAKNLTDKEYETKRFSFIGTSMVSAALPRTYGASVTWGF